MENKCKNCEYYRTYEVDFIGVCEKTQRQMMMNDSCNLFEKVLEVEKSEAKSTDYSEK